jgi:hypothetical protein
MSLETRKVSVWSRLGIKSVLSKRRHQVISEISDGAESLVYTTGHVVTPAEAAHSSEQPPNPDQPQSVAVGPHSRSLGSVLPSLSRLPQLLSHPPSEPEKRVWFGHLWLGVFFPFLSEACLGLCSMQRLEELCTASGNLVSPAT